MEKVYRKIRDEYTFEEQKHWSDEQENNEEFSNNKQIPDLITQEAKEDFEDDDNSDIPDPETVKREGDLKRLKAQVE